MAASLYRKLLGVPKLGKATIVTTQLHIDHRNGWIGDATVADAILGRLMQRINRSGESMRRPAAANARKPVA